MKTFNTNIAIEQHGGNPSCIDAHYPDAPKPLMDLSTGINPYGYPTPPIDNNWHYRLADSAAMQRAYEAVAKYYKVKHCVLASGMQPLMVALAALRLREYGVSTIGIVSPTYGEHERVWRNMGHDCRAITDIAPSNHDVVILCNPNNPDGRIFPPESLLKLAGQLAQRGGWLIVDESFADVSPTQSICGYVHNYDNIVVLRSCGKFFGVAGLRVSAAIASEACIEWLCMMSGPWPISTAACHILPAMLLDSAWVEGMRSRLAKEAQAWREVLARYFSIAGYTDLFTLVETDCAQDWFGHLASQGILVRRFDYNQQWLRFGLPDAVYIKRISAALGSKP